LASSAAGASVQRLDAGRAAHPVNQDGTPQFGGDFEVRVANLDVELRQIEEPALSGDSLPFFNVICKNG
jgi:hypothetical protein